MQDVGQDLIELARRVIALGYKSSEAIPIREWEHFGLPASPRIFKLLDSMVYVLMNQHVISVREEER